VVEIREKKMQRDLGRLVQRSRSSGSLVVDERERKEVER
jgi:hypothetical protein